MLNFNTSQLNGFQSKREARFYQLLIHREREQTQIKFSLFVAKCFFIQNLPQFHQIGGVPPQSPSLVELEKIVRHYYWFYKKKCFVLSHLLPCQCMPALLPRPLCLPSPATALCLAGSYALHWLLHTPPASHHSLGHARLWPRAQALRASCLEEETYIFSFSFAHLHYGGSNTWVQISSEIVKEMELYRNFDNPGSS